MSETDPKIKGYISLESVVSNVKNDMEDYTPKGYSRLMQLAIRGVREMSLHSGITFEKQWLTLSDVKVVKFPSDYVRFLAIGIPYYGKLWTFTKKSGMIDPLTEVDGVPELDATIGEGETIGDGGSIAGYGVAGGRNKVGYKIDEDSEHIVLNGYLGTRVLLYYVSTGVSLSGTTRLPAITYEVLIAWVHWKRLQFTNTTATDKKMAEANFDRAYEIMEDAKRPSLEDLYDAVYAGFHQSLKV